MEATSDALLVTAARGGDGAAYGELFARYQSRIYNYAYGIAGNRDDAADIAQEAFVRVFETLPRLTGELNFSAYVYRTTHNVAIDTVKGRGRFEAPEALDMQMEPSLRADPERVTLVKEQQQQAWQAAFQLSDDHRSILTLRELHDLSYQEIAEIMDMPRNTVGVLLSRARLRFKEAYRMSSVDIDRANAQCRDILPLLSAYLDDELDDKKRAQVEAHLEQCAFCRLALEEMTESSRSYRAILPLLPPAALGETVWHRLGDTVTSARPASASGATETAGVPGGLARPSTAQVKSGRRYLQPKLLVAAAGGVAIIVLGTLAVTGDLGGWGGRGGPGENAALAGITAESSATTAVAPTTASTTASTTVPVSSTPGASTATTVATTSDPPATVATTSVASTSTSSTSVSTGSTTETSSPESRPEVTGAEPPSTTVTEAGDTGPPPTPGDTVPPPTPGVIYPAAGDVVKGSTVVLQWKPVKDPSGVTYRVEVQSFDKKAGAYVTSQSVDGLKGSELKHVMAATIERWRITAVDGAGNESKPSAWAKFASATLDLPTIRPTLTTITSLDLPDLIAPETTTSTTVILY